MRQFERARKHAGDTQRIRYVNGAPHLVLPPGRWEVHERRHSHAPFYVVEHVTVPAGPDFLRPIGGAIDDVRAIPIAGGDPWSEEFRRGTEVE
jgi:hypothetical protein